MTKRVASKRRKLISSSTSLSEQPFVAELIASNVDILTEILVRLPAKSLIRFKCVSKHWLSLISDPQFAQDHSCRNCSSLICGIYHDPWSTMEEIIPVSFHSYPSLPPLAFLDNIGGHKSCIFCSCNGLMFGARDYEKSYIIFNPTTQKYTLVPSYTGCTISNLNTATCLAFDPAKSSHFKVVLINYFEDVDEDEEEEDDDDDDDRSSIDGDSGDRCSYKIDVYSSKCASWKQLRFVAPPGIPYKHKVFWNGAINWINDRNIYVRFDVDAEKLTDTPLPPRPQILEEYMHIRYFGECGGNLLLIQIRNQYAMGFRVLEMNRDCCSWTVKYRVNLRPLVSSFPEMVENSRYTTSSKSKRWRFSVLHVIMGANKKDCSLLLAIPGKKIVSYNLKTKNSRCSHVRRNFEGWGFLKIDIYILIHSLKACFPFEYFLLVGADVLFVQPPWF